MPNSQRLILALDVATTCGWARGEVGSIPDSGSVRFGGNQDSGDKIFRAGLDWIEGMLTSLEVPDLLIVEAMLPPDAMKGQTTRWVRDRLAGLHGIMRGVASKRGVGEIAQASVGAVRHHFIGHPQLPRQQAKRETMAQCKRLGWPVEDDNAADACALFSYACAIINPASALQVSPLFNPKLKVTTWP